MASPSGREQLRAITRRLRDEEGCDAVALVCTELPLLVDPADPPALPALDSARILAEAALRRVCGPARAL